MNELEDVLAIEDTDAPECVMINITSDYSVHEASDMGAEVGVTEHP